MALTLVTPPPVEPVSLLELKEFVRVDAGDTSQDNLLTTLGMAARTWVEAFLQRRLVQQVWNLQLDYFPGQIDTKLANQAFSTPLVSGGTALLSGLRYAIRLPYPPVSQIGSFTFTSPNGNVIALEPGVDYTADLAANPARLVPFFGKMWPPAMVIPNAISVIYVLGYAMFLVVSLTSTSAPYTAIQAQNYVFEPSDINRPISIDGAGPNGSALNTVIASISSPPDSNAVLRDEAISGVKNADALLVNNPNANPAHWELAKSGIKLLVERWFEIRVPDENTVPAAVRSLLSPARNLIV